MSKKKEKFLANFYTLHQPNTTCLLTDILILLQSIFGSVCQLANRRCCCYQCKPTSDIYSDWCYSENTSQQTKIRAVIFRQFQHKIYRNKLIFVVTSSNSLLFVTSIYIAIYGITRTFNTGIRHKGLDCWGCWSIMACSFSEEDECDFAKSRILWGQRKPFFGINIFISLPIDQHMLNCHWKR